MSTFLSPEAYFDSIVEDLAANKQKYINLNNILEDEKSKKVLNTILSSAGRRSVICRGGVSGSLVAGPGPPHFQSKDWLSVGRAYSLRFHH